ncbi:MAG TPA: M64 family metallopeptidase, partial [Bacteroidota bacterium]
MRTLSWITLLSLALPLSVASQSIDFAEFFSDSTLRVDYYHIGDKNAEFITLDRLRVEGRWAGNPHALLMPDEGRYAVKVHDGAGGRLLYAYGFDSYFGEYKTTEPAGKGIKRTFQETVLLPLPKRPVTLSIEMRKGDRTLQSLFTATIDPADYHIVRESPVRGDEIINVLVNGDPHTHVDLAIVGDGYTTAERGKFEADLHWYADILFSVEPYKSQKDRFNIRGIFVASPESGVDEPRQGRYRHTALNATFNSLDSDRYLLTEEMRTLRDITGQVPCDAVLVMVNSKRYGGGGIYNTFTLYTSDGTWNDYVFLHEFGHAFAGLADEYYTSDVAYDQFYQPGVEPLEPNVTALLDPSHLKWGKFVDPGLPIPTEWGQARYDSLTAARDSLTARRGRELAEL